MKKLILVVAMMVMAGQAWGMDYSGVYVDKKNGGDIEIRKNGKANDEYSVKITVVPTGTTNIGEVAFSGFFNNGKMAHISDGCSLEMILAGNKSIIVKQDTSAGTCDAGMDVYFSGTYRKTKKK